MKATPLLLCKSLFFLFITALLLPTLPSAFAQAGAEDPDESPFLELISTDGVKIEAEILKVENNSVQIRRRDRQEFTFPLSMLNDKSRQLVQAWAIDQALANSLDIRVRERNLRREKSNSNTRSGEIKTVQYQFTLNNKSATAIDGLRIEYRIYVRREQLNVPNSKFGTEEVIPGKLTVNRLDGGREVVLEANPAVKLIEEKYHSNVVPTYGSNRTSQDKIEGYWYKVYRGKNLITENASPRRLMQIKKW